MRKEWYARILVITLAAAAVAVPLLVRRVSSQPPLLHARMAETGGWSLAGSQAENPGDLTAVAGEPLRLRLTSDDVVHSFAVGQAAGMPEGIAAVDILPGEISEITLNFDRPGKYTYYCTRWCSVNHWRMRGVIEVSPPAAGVASGSDTPASEAPDPELPLYLQLGIDPDAERPDPAVLPARPPSAARGAALEADIPAEFLGQDYYRAHSPAELWSSLRATSSLAGLTDQDVWDLVALAYQAQTTPAALQSAAETYSQNCAACHGERGGGDGVFADDLALPETGEHASMPDGEMTTTPAGFSDPARLLSASPALLHGKILRGGMGTGMPYWGPIFTADQIWDLVAYLYTFQFAQEP
ncbi:MAG TPA: c-type cytochrome [Anaerolineales bacterium]|nr:c-type cytochrome [Anaerolineales bacterium]